MQFLAISKKTADKISKKSLLNLYKSLNLQPITQ